MLANASVDHLSSALAGLFMSRFVTSRIVHRSRRSCPSTYMPSLMSLESLMVTPYYKTPILTATLRSTTLVISASGRRRQTSRSLNLYLYLINGVVLVYQLFTCDLRVPAEQAGRGRVSSSCGDAFQQHLPQIIHDVSIVTPRQKNIET